MYRLLSCGWSHLTAALLANKGLLPGTGGGGAGDWRPSPMMDMYVLPDRIFFHRFITFLRLVHRDSENHTLSGTLSSALFRRPSMYLYLHVCIVDISY